MLATDVDDETKEVTVEPAHEALLRQWGLLQGWLAEDAGLLSVLDGVKRATRDWEANRRNKAWLAHTTRRLDDAERLNNRSDLSANLMLTDRAYLNACRWAEKYAKWRQRTGYAVVVLLLGLGVAAWANRPWIEREVQRSQYLIQHYEAVIKSDAERDLKSGATFQDCTKGSPDCPEMVVVPAGKFMMGSPQGKGKDRERPQREVTIAKAFAVSKFEVTFAQWDACVSYGGCAYRPKDQGWGRGNRPVINVSWEDAIRYVAWLSKMTGEPYRLLTEAEWEYAARAGSTTRFSWGDEIGKGNAVCSYCGSQWDNKQTAPVGSFKPNAFGLYDMHGNVYEWVEDCYGDYKDAPKDGSAKLAKDCSGRVVRGGGWGGGPGGLRSASRIDFRTVYRVNDFGFRVGRTLRP